jgi:hypothetical protein
LPLHCFAYVCIDVAAVASLATHALGSRNDVVRPSLGSMPRYHFHVRFEGSSPDNEGSELIDMRAAWREAVTMTGGIIRELYDKLKLDQDWELEVTDEFRNTLWVITLRTRSGLYP